MGAGGGGQSLNSAPVRNDRPSPHPAAHFIRVDPPPPGEGETELLPFFPREKCLARKSASTSTRAGRGPPGGVTRCTEPSVCFQPFRITSTSPDAIASPTIKSGRSAMPSPAISAGNNASPLLTRSGPAGRTLASPPAELV